MKKLIAFCTSMLITLSAQATLINIELDKTIYQVGEVVQADIIVSDIERDLGVQKLVASFDFTLLFNSTLLTYESTTFGNLLDVEPFLASDKEVTNSPLGSLSLSEISYAFGDDLFAAQDGLTSFVLASVNFTVLAHGLNVLNINNIDLGDDLSNSFTNVSSAPIEFIVEGSTSVPEVPTLAIFALGILGFVARQQNR